MEEDKLLEEFTILINAWDSLDDRQVSQLAESLCEAARSRAENLPTSSVSDFLTIKQVASKWGERVRCMYLDHRRLVVSCCCAVVAVLIRIMNFQKHTEDEKRKYSQ